MPSLHLSDGSGGQQQRRPKPSRPLKPSIEPLPSSNGNSAPAAAQARDGESSFCRALASGDPSTRLRALDALVAWLVAKGNSSDSNANSVTKEDMRKLWKGMFYSYWHSDLAPVQKQLATRMAGIAGELQPELSALYLDAFYETLAREWSGLDRLRLDKFMLLVRSFVEATFGLAAGTTARVASSSSSSCSASAATAASSAPWCPKRAERLLRPLSEAMCPPAGAPLLSSGSGLGLHLADVAAGELLRAVAASSSQSSSSAAAPSTSTSSASSTAQQEGILAAVLPFSRAAATTQRPELATRLSREFFSKVAAAIREGGGSEGEESNGKKSKKSLPNLLSPALAALLSKQLLSLESLPETRARNREVLYSAAAELEAAGEEAKREDKREKKRKVGPEEKEVAAEQQRGGEKSKKRAAAAAPEAAAPPTPPIGAPTKAAAEQAAAAAAAGGAAAAVVPPEAKKAKTAAPATAAAAAAAAATPTTTPAAASQAAASAAYAEEKEKKRVRWSFKSNLAHAVGGPVPPPHVRTPPGSAPRGSALKVKGAGVKTRRGAAAAAAEAEAEAAAGGNRKGGSARARVDAFF